MTQYIETLKLLKFTTLRLKGCSKAGNFSAIYKVILVFKYLLTNFKVLITLYKHINYNAYSKALKDYLAINIKAA
jgi:hypothetical protein